MKYMLGCDMCMMWVEWSKTFGLYNFFYSNILVTRFTHCKYEEIENLKLVTEL